MIDILSLGAGVQSTTLLLMSCTGVLPALDCAIFADTGWESPATYNHLDWLIPEAKNHGIPVHILKGANIKEDALISQVRGRKSEGSRWVSMPFHTQQPDGGKGMIRRQCTREYKSDPIDRFIRQEILGLKRYQRAPKEIVVDQWFGISLDEINRARTSRDKWRRYCYPLLNVPQEYLPKLFTRHDCLGWLAANYPKRHVPRSACVGCPFHSNAEWRMMQAKHPDVWADAVEFDARMRHAGGMRGEIYLHRHCQPLPEAIVDDSKDQVNMFENECEGLCGV